MENNKTLYRRATVIDVKFTSRKTPIGRKVLLGYEPIEAAISREYTKKSLADNASYNVFKWNYKTEWPNIKEAEAVRSELRPPYC